VRTVIETPTFKKRADAVWSEDERLTFISWIARNPQAGDVIPGADGARKVRWMGTQRGKSGGVRVIYFNLAADSTVYLITLYRKSEHTNIQPDAIKRAQS
jgi:mRNA-degrading endonuclease RelE of RelBE toxin-antitoxin system